MSSGVNHLRLAGRGERIAAILGLISYVSRANNSNTNIFYALDSLKGHLRDTKTNNKEKMEKCRVCIDSIISDLPEKREMLRVSLLMILELIEQELLEPEEIPDILKEQA